MAKHAAWTFYVRGTQEAKQ